MYLVYVATSPCGKSYVGATSRSLEVRKAEHQRAAASGHRSKFCNALRLFGFHSFTWRIAHYCGSVSEMFAKEISTIQTLGTFRAGFNSTQGGDGTVRGRTSAYTAVRDSRRALKRAQKG